MTQSSHATQRQHLASEASSENVRRLRAEPEWAKAHAALSTLAKERAALDGREAVWLLKAYRAGAHYHLGYGSFAEYAERTLGYGARTTDDRLRTAEALEHLPLLTQALNDGRIHWTAVRELARVATIETESEWLMAVRTRTVREIEHLVSGRARGDRPSDMPRPEARRHVLRFEVYAETFATFREAVKSLRQNSDERLDDDAVLLLMARHALGARTTAERDGRASYQIAMTLCESCGRGTQQAGGENIDVDPTVVDMAKCDAQHVGLVDSGQTNLTHVGGEDATAPAKAVRPELSPPQPKPARATQTIPPALRRRVVRRDRGCCVVPGCRNSTFTDVHHLTPRAEGGLHDADNLVVLCSAHHRAAHRGLLVIAGSVGTGLTFTRQDGNKYGAEVSAEEADIQAKVFQALRGLGFKEREARWAMNRVVADSDGTQLGAQDLLRSAVLMLTPDSNGRRDRGIAWRARLYPP